MLIICFVLVKYKNVRIYRLISFLEVPPLNAVLKFVLYKDYTKIKLCYVRRVM